MLDKPFVVRTRHVGQVEGCTALQVYLPMCYIYGMRDKLRSTPLTAALRQELYLQDYETINWDSTRNQCAKEDLFYPHPKVVSFMCLPFERSCSGCAYAVKTGLKKFLQDFL